MNNEFLTDEYRKKIKKYIKKNNDNKGYDYITKEDIFYFLFNLHKIPKDKVYKFICFLNNKKLGIFVGEEDMFILNGMPYHKTVDDILNTIEAMYDEYFNILVKWIVNKLCKTKSTNTTLKLNWKGKDITQLLINCNEIGDVNIESIRYFINGEGDCYKGGYGLKLKPNKQYTDFVRILLKYKIPLKGKDYGIVANFVVNSKGKHPNGGESLRSSFNKMKKKQGTK